MIKGQIAAPVVDKILERLSTDHDFRERFIGDPSGALGEYGVEVDPANIPAVRRLPPMEEMAQVRRKAAGTDDPLSKVGLTFFILK